MWVVECFEALVWLVVEIWLWTWSPVSGRGRRRPKLPGRL